MLSYVNKKYYLLGNQIHQYQDFLLVPAAAQPLSISTLCVTRYRKCDHYYLDTFYSNWLDNKVKRTTNTVVKVKDLDKP